MGEEARSRNHGGGILEEISLVRNHGEELMGEDQGQGIRDEEHEEEILEEASCRRHLGRTQKH